MGVYSPISSCSTKRSSCAIKVSSCSVDIPAQQPSTECVENKNPNPSDFKFTQLHAHKKYIVAMVNYPNCTNYEGDKILVFKDVSLKELYSLKKLDPHFCDGAHVSPIARFTPTEEGWSDAVTFVTAMMHKEE